MELDMFMIHHSSIATGKCFTNRIQPLAVAGGWLMGDDWLIMVRLLVDCG